MVQIHVTQLSKQPVYEQIQEQIKECILKGELKSGEQLPSIRVLARHLQVGLITIKRAYQELEQEGLVVNLQGRGCFVGMLDQEALHRRNLETAKQQLQTLHEFSMRTQLSKDEIKNLMEEIWEVKR